MSEWNDLERLWQSLPASAAPAVEELMHQSRWRWVSHLTVFVEVVIAVAAGAVGALMLARGDLVSVVIGVATLLFVTVAAGGSVWARALGPARADDPVARTVETAIRHARVGVRSAFAALWTVCAALVFLAVMSLAFDFDSARGSSHVAIAAAQMWLAVWLGGAVLYLRKRSADLARLEALKLSLSLYDKQPG